MRKNRKSTPAHMKSKHLLVIGIWFNLFSCTSQTQHGFSDSYKSNFFETCFASSLGVLGAQGALEYCQCTLDLLQEKFTDSDKADKWMGSLSQDELLDFVAPCKSEVPTLTMELPVGYELEAEPHTDPYNIFWAAKGGKSPVGIIEAKFSNDWSFSFLTIEDLLDVPNEEFTNIIGTVYSDIRIALRRRQNLGLRECAHSIFSGYHTDSKERQTVAVFQFIEHDRLYTVSMTSLSGQFDTEYKEFLKAVDTLGFQ